MITANVAPTAKMLTQPVISNTAAIAGSVFPRASDASNSRMINIWNKLVAVGNGEAREALDVGDPLRLRPLRSPLGHLPSFVHAGLPSGRLTSSNVATWVLSIQDSNTAPQISQDTSPPCGIKHAASRRLYSAPLT